MNNRKTEKLQEKKSHLFREKNNNFLIFILEESHPKFSFKYLNYT